MNDPIYLDYNATTPVAPEVIEEMVPALERAWGNPSSGHAHGVRAARAVGLARSRVASLLGCRMEEVVFTGGGTESDNAAVIGIAEASSGRGNHVVTSAIEHPALERACAYLESRGWTVSRVPVGSEGAVDPGEVLSTLRPETVLVSIMHANNETGVIQPIREIARIVRARGIAFHTDAAQSVGKLPVHVDELEVDALTIAGHKLYAPKGIGALYLRTGTPFTSFMHGAEHEGGRRAGTENTPGIVGLGAACELAERELEARRAHLGKMRDRLEAGLRTALPDLAIHGTGAARLPNTLSCAIPGIDANDLLTRLEGVAAAAGAACHSDTPAPSSVLRAMGVPDALAVCTLRLTVGRETTSDEIDEAVERIVAATRNARR